MDEPGFGFSEVVVEGAVGIGIEGEDFEGIEGAIMDPEFIAPGFGVEVGRMFHMERLGLVVTGFGGARGYDIGELLAGDSWNSPSLFRNSPGIFHL